MSSQLDTALKNARFCTYSPAAADGPGVNPAFPRTASRWG